jgi:membrane-bound serine protease (ClpP class)
MLAAALDGSLLLFLNHPVVSAVLLALGVLGLLVELKSPHFGVAALIGLASLGTFFGSHLLIGLAGWEVLLLLAAAIVLLGVEALVLPGFGVAGVLGVLALVAGVVVTLVGTTPTAADLMLAIYVLGGALLMVVLLGWLFLQHLPHDRRAQRLVLQTSTAREAGFLSNPLRHELLGTQGVALTDLRPAGTAAFGEESVDVVSEGGWVSAGTKIEVVRAEGYRHVVRPVDG